MSIATQSATATPMESIMTGGACQMSRTFVALCNDSDQRVEHVRDHRVQRRDAAEEQHCEESSKVAPRGCSLHLLMR